MKHNTREEVVEYLKTQKAFAHILRYDSYEYTRNVVYEETKNLHEAASFGLRVKVFLGEIEIPKCPCCGLPCIPLKSHIAFQATCGGQSCMTENVKNKIIKTSIKRYGTKFPNQNKSVYEKVKAGNIKKYGVANYTQTEEGRKKATERLLSDDVVNKRKRAVSEMWDTRKDELVQSLRGGMLEKYGVEFASQSEEIRELSKETQFEKYGGWFLSSDIAKAARVDSFGHENYFSTTEFKENLKKKRLEELGVEHHLQKPLMFSKLSDAEWLLKEYSKRPITSIAEELNTTSSTVWNYLTALGIQESSHGAKNYSEAEKEITSFVESLGFSCVRNTRKIIPPVELDIYVKEKNIAIEFNGVYWHSDKYKSKSFHQEKSLRCAELGIQLIHIWSDDWYLNEKRDVIKKKLMNKLGVSEKVYARKCSVISPSVDSVKMLYNDNHIQGFVRATSHIGLEYEGRLVACASFHNKGNGVWDLVRFASSTSVVGGFSKILAHFTKNYDFDKIVTFAHLDYSHGNLYEKTGFEKKHITPPGMFYTKGNVRERREGYMKHLLPTKLRCFDPDMTERENMAANGYLRVYDAGSIRYELSR